MREAGQRYDLIMFISFCFPSFVHAGLGDRKISSQHHSYTPLSYQAFSTIEMSAVFEGPIFSQLGWCAAIS